MNADEVQKDLTRESVKQGENLRAAVRELTLNALKSRQGKNLRESHVKKALDELEQFGDRVRDAVRQQRRTALLQQGKRQSGDKAGS